MGAFYCFPSFANFIGTNKPFIDDYTLADYLLNKADVATVPGSVFGAPGHLRLSFAINEVELKKALLKIEAALEDLKKRI